VIERLRVPPVDDPDLIVEVDFRGGAVIRLVGSADNAATHPLAELLQKLHAELRERAVREVVVDLSSADSLAPACFKQLVAWLGRVHELPAADRYRIKLRINRSIRWQVHALPALTCFDTGVVTVEN
jgi:hypothetical protein